MQVSPMGRFDSLRIPSRRLFGWRWAPAQAMKQLRCRDETTGDCGVSEVEVSGMVTMDKHPLKEGDIVFEESDKSKTPAAGKIVEGRYTLKVLPGSKTVRITASRP